MSDPLSHDYLIFTIAQAGFYVEDPKSYSILSKPGILAKEGIKTTTKYFKLHREFFKKKGVRKPDLFLVDEKTNLQITVEIEADDTAPNFVDQICFFSDKEYYEEIVDKKNHEVWIVAPTNYINILKKKIDKKLEEPPISELVYYGVTFDKNRTKYYFQNISGGPPLELPFPKTFPLLSANVSEKFVIYSFGSNFFKKIQDPPGEKSISDIYNEMEECALDKSFVEKCIKKLAILCPELCEWKRNTNTLKIKKNIIKHNIITNKLQEIAKIDANDLPDLINKRQEELESKKRKSKIKKTSLKKKTLRPTKDQQKLPIKFYK
jgi:hypothetical protein